MVIKFLSDIFSHIVVVAGPENCHKVGHNGYDINTEKRIFQCPFLLVFQLVFTVIYQIVDYSAFVDEVEQVIWRKSERF